MSSPTPPPAPVILPDPGPELWEQVQSRLAADSDPQNGLLAALAQRADDSGAFSAANSIYPNFVTSGPGSDRNVCPTPFVVVYDMGGRATDAQGRDYKIGIELHADRDLGQQYLPGLKARLVEWLAGSARVPAWRPTDTDHVRYYGGLQMDEWSPILQDDRYTTDSVQMVFTCRGADRTSNRGRQG